MSSETSYFAIGVTGLVGSHFLNLATKSSNVNKIVTLSRREPVLDKSGNNKTVFEPIVSKDTDEWPEIIKSKLNIPENSTIFSSFGTTRKNAGSAENFVKIDHDINVNAFKAAKESGKFSTAVLVSSLGANKDSMFLYLSTKGKIEEDLKALKFTRTIILQPGMLLGERTVSKGLGNSLGERVGRFFRGTFVEGYIGSPIYAEEVAKAVLFLTQQPIDKPGEVLVVKSKELVDLVRKNKL
ncbi:hypothetical protein FOA43_004784 [Brettanomyces nanus]|uniref:Uncharacterized protein n=1 Tax=Eeniella nana TaxID=13502 RepID=A0A875S721_EENNA|nr:uncharacterized protein FOA43_004784 [Brettanomyces nanus]QPG77371.1 hypothetical protein FOA43_004784 [Brettanomyces nanus]